ncbi:gamma-glutamyl hydrolase A-like isoform X2 [Leptopilina heterotoma]|uniref:gamma-glutamyl hydrolase A-like isoform X2 n=1 Tax=Leptopilina heterotoma TaxID=63436 RepID=UPI001CAA0AD1|nr:gamma-glutamyl hydrolase A-like isoform X2 [Leptopilina heterotoma]
MIFLKVFCNSFCLLIRKLIKFFIFFKNTKFCKICHFNGGILSQEISYSLNNQYPNQYNSYIAASYVKFIEGAGARCVPIWIGKDDSYYENITSKINGVLFPGGSTWFNQKNGYADAGEKIYKIAKRYNDNGDYFPILGTCLGFELLTYLAANRVEHRSNCSSNAQALPLHFSSGYEKSQMFKNAPKKVVHILHSENVTANFHRFCVTKSDLEKVHLTDVFNVMSLNYDKNGFEFISTIEDKKYPFYGIQFHPEKNVYEWVEGKNIPHGKNPTIVNQYFANFFVDEARKNLHKFNDKNDEINSLIYNYPVTYTKSSFVQCYLFNTN